MISMTDDMADVVVVAVHRVRAGQFWQMQGVMLDSNYNLFRFLVPHGATGITNKRWLTNNLERAEFGDWVPGTFIKLISPRVIEMAVPQKTPVRPWMIILNYRATPPPPNILPTAVEEINKDYVGFIFHYSTINQVMAFGELWCQPHNWRGRKELAGCFTSTEEYLDQFAKETGKNSRPALAIVTMKENQLEYETRYVTRIDTWKNKKPLEKVYPGGCTCFSAFHCTECLAVWGAIDPEIVSSQLLDDDLVGATVERYEQWYTNNIPGATASAPFPGCLRTAIIRQTQKDLQQKDLQQVQKDLQRDIKEQVQNEFKHDGTTQEGGETMH